MPKLVFSFDYPPLDGGIARLCAEIVTGLSAESHVTVLTQQRFDVGSHIPTGHNISETRLTGKRPLREISAWWRLLRRHRKDAVIVSTWYPEGLIARMAGCKDIVVLAHGAELMPPVQTWRRRIWGVLQSAVLSHASVVVANSRYTAELVKTVSPEANVVAVPLAVDANRFRPGDQRTSLEKFGLADREGVVISTVTRIHAFKGIDTVLRAIANLPAEDREKLTYLIAGRGSAMESLQRLARELGIESSVHWLGFVPEEDLPDVYRASDLFVLCTRDAPDVRSVEGFGLVFLEAQASGVPAIGTRTGGIPDAISHDEGGWLIEQDDFEVLAVYLSRLVRESKLFEAEGHAARQRIERECTWEQYIYRFGEAIYGTEKRK